MKDEEWKELVAHMAATNTRLKNIDDSIKKVETKIETQNGRIGKLENWQSWMKGGMAVIGVFIGAILTKIFHD